MRVTAKRLHVRILGAAGQEHRVRALVRLAVEELDTRLATVDAGARESVDRLIVPAIRLDMRSAATAQLASGIADAVHVSVVTPRESGPEMPRHVQGARRW
jgi:hypothetical protein